MSTLFQIVCSQVIDQVPVLKPRVTFKDPIQNGIEDGPDTDNEEDSWRVDKPQSKLSMLIFERNGLRFQKFSSACGNG